VRRRGHVGMPVTQTIFEFMQQLSLNIPRPNKVYYLFVRGRGAGGRQPHALENTAGRARFQLHAAEKLAGAVVTERRFEGERAFGLSGSGASGVVFDRVAVEFPRVG